MKSLLALLRLALPVLLLALFATTPLAAQDPPDDPDQPAEPDVDEDADADADTDTDEGADADSDTTAADDDDTARTARDLDREAGLPEGSNLPETGTSAPGDGDEVAAQPDMDDGEKDGENEPEFRISGLAYMGWAIDFASQSGVANQFFVSKAYVAVDALIDEHISARFALEMSDPSGQLGSGLVNALFVKDMYIAAHNLFLDGDLIRVGLHPAIWLETEESWWNYRFVSRSISEQQNIVHPNDFGFSYTGSLADGKFRFKVGLYNGGGAAGTQQGLFDDLPGTITDVWKTPGIEVGYFDDESGFVLAAGWQLSAGPSNAFDRRGARFFFGTSIGNLEKDGFNASLSAYYALDRNTGFQDGDALGFSLWGSLAGNVLSADLEAFGAMLRFDLFDANTKNSTDLFYTIWLGAVWTPSEVFRTLVGWRFTHNLDTGNTPENVLGVWVDFHFG